MGAFYQLGLAFLVGTLFLFKKKKHQLVVHLFHLYKHT